MFYSHLGLIHLRGHGMHRHFAGRLAASIDYDWPNRDPADEDAIRATLRGIGDSCRRLHDDIDAAYFSYGLGDGEDGR